MSITEEIPNASGSKVMIASGALIALISFLGCCGAWRENRCMLIIVSLDFTLTYFSSKEHGHYFHQIEMYSC